MLLGIFVIIELIAIILFFASFFTKQEILWAVTSVLFGFLMFASYNLEVYIYEYDISIGAYASVLTANSYPFLMGINMLFFSLALLLGLFDIFEKYGINLFNKGK